MSMMHTVIRNALVECKENLDKEREGAEQRRDAERGIQARRKA